MANSLINEGMKYRWVYRVVQNKPIISTFKFAFNNAPNTKPFEGESECGNAVEV